MKKLLELLLLFPIAAAGQTLVTNRITAHPDFREVDGRLYNVRKSVAWQDVEGSKIQALPDGLTLGRQFEIIRHGYDPGPLDSMARIGGFSQRVSPFGSFVTTSIETNWGDYFLLRNYEGGRSIKARALPLAETNWHGRPVQIFDCGKPHIVEIISPENPKAAKR